MNYCFWLQSVPCDAKIGSHYVKIVIDDENLHKLSFLRPVLKIEYLPSWLFYYRKPNGNKACSILLHFKPKHKKPEFLQNLH